MKSVVKIGDHIEKINGISMVGVRHFEVAKALKNIPVGSVFTLRLIEVNSPGFRKMLTRLARCTSSGLR